MVDGIWKMLSFDAKGGVFSVAVASLSNQRIVVRQEIGRVKLKSRLVTKDAHNYSGLLVRNSTGKRRQYSI